MHDGKAAAAPQNVAGGYSHCWHLRMHTSSSQRCAVVMATLTNAKPAGHSLCQCLEQTISLKHNTRHWHQVASHYLLCAAAQELRLQLPSALKPCSRAAIAHCRIRVASFLLLHLLQLCLGYCSSGLAGICAYSMLGTQCLGAV